MNPENHQNPAYQGQANANQAVHDQATPAPTSSATDTFNYHSLRATEARAAATMNHPLFKALLTLFIIISTAGAIYALFFLHNALGWLCLAASIFLTMCLVYIIGELAKVPVGPSESIDDLLSANVLRLLNPATTTPDLAKNLIKTRSGSFLALRFGITPNLLSAIAGDPPADLTPVFHTAREIMHAVDGETISGGILAIAMIENHPHHEYILSQMKLELSDLYDGLIWYNHLHGIVKSAKKHVRDGGIARDFTFGYIPTLQHLGTNLSDNRSPIKTQIHLSSHHQIVDQIISIFSANGRQNVALIGPAGSGRTTIVRAFSEAILDADAKIPASLKYRQVFMLDAASLISTADHYGGLENLMMRILGEAYAAKNIILCLDNAQLFFESATGSVDISNILLPILEAGRLRIILTMDEQKFLEISSSNSALANSLNKIMVAPTNRTETLKILEDQVPMIEARHNVICTYWALTEAYRLSERYIHDLEMPGRAINLFESACNYPDPSGLVTAESVARAIEQTQGVKIQSTDTTERAQLLNLEQLIHERMVDQASAVKAVSDALRRAVAGVRNQNRPIGTFLFLGPTGVGKTELAKAISEVYFNGENHIIRLDLNEYVTAADVQRLIADGADNPDSLTASVLKQPFAVVLLDEIEKAHPQVLTTLLQVLDEGILRDANNHEVSFRDTIIIATSNAGADQIRDFISSGQSDISIYRGELVDHLIETGEFKPEFLNRFDEICLFKPLSKDELVQVVDLIIGSINRTLAPQKIAVELDYEAKLLLVDRGYDPQMGARPMRRIVQKSVENLVAKLMLMGTLTPGSLLHITPDMLRTELDS